MYSLDRRKLAHHVYSLLFSLRKTAKILQVSHSTISRWLQNTDRKKYVRSVKSKTDIVVDIIKAIIKNDPFISIVKLRKAVEDISGVIVSKELVRIAIKRIGISKKKARFYGVSSNSEEKTREFILQRDNYVSVGRRFVSIDETSFGRSGIQTHGYSEVGKPLFIRKAVPRMTTVTSTCAVTSDGNSYTSTRQGSMNTSLYLEFLKTVPFKTNDVVLMDNVAFHHSQVIKDYIKSIGCIALYVPPYSPWFNPIELCFSIVKRHYYQHQNISTAFDALTPSHILAFFKKSLNCHGL